MTQFFETFHPEPGTEPVIPPPKTTITRLQDLDVETELLNQYNRAIKLSEDIESDKEITPNQKAAVIGAITTILANITKMQTDLYNAERLKELEAILLGVLRDFPTINREFLEKYRERLGVQ